MGMPKLSRKLHLAGKQFHRQLHDLGLKPEAVLWVHDIKRDAFVLWLVWSGVDRVGPYEVMKLIFKAYRASALTHDIDPFMIEIRSTGDIIGNHALETSRHRIFINGKRADLYRVSTGMSNEVDDADYQWTDQWIYEMKRVVKQPKLADRDWANFTFNVSQLAA